MDALLRNGNICNILHQVQHGTNLCWACPDCELELACELREQPITLRQPCAVQVAHANAEWRQILCEQYFDIWDKLRQPRLSACEEEALQAQLEMKAKETQNRSVVEWPLLHGCCWFHMCGTVPAHLIYMWQQFI